ncbi:MAG: hypothetical protein MHPSP_001225, partial [Paramarteilia canceri]
LYALGYSTNKMDVTVDGFVSWMWKGLSFLLPFLIVAYATEVYLVYKLVVIQYEEPNVGNWQAGAMAILLGIMSFGNLSTMTIIFWRKYTTGIRDLPITRYSGIEKLLEKSQPLSKFYASFSRLHNNN